MLGVFNALLDIVRVITCVVTFIPAVLVGVIKMLVMAFDVLISLAGFLPSSFYVFIVSLVCVSIIYKIIGREGSK